MAGRRSAPGGARPGIRHGPLAALALLGAAIGAIAPARWGQAAEWSESPEAPSAFVTVLDARRYDERFELFAKVTNLFDEDYENFGLLGEEPAEVLPDLPNQSPVFLGAGAPVAGWVGLRVRL